jgi:hypothetical protein
MAVNFENVPAEGFGIIPNWLVRESSLSAYALLAYVALSGRADRSGECWPSIATLAKEARCSASSARRAVRELRLAGLVTVRSQQRTHDGGQSSNVYRVYISSDPKPPVSQRQPPAVTGKPGPSHTDTLRRHKEEDPVEEDPQAVKATLSSGRSKAKVHRSDVLASDAQIAFMRDNFIMLHQHLPNAADDADWRAMSSADAHETIREYWSEIEHGNEWLLTEAIEGFREHLSDRAISFIESRLELQP